MSRSSQPTGRRSRYDYHYSIPQPEVFDTHYAPLYEPIGGGGSLFGESVRSSDWDVKVQDWTPIPRPQLLPSVVKSEPVKPLPVAHQRRAFTVLQPAAEPIPAIGMVPIGGKLPGIDDPNAILASSYKIQPTVRQHKKSAFSIIAELTPHQSRAASPDLVPSSGRISPFKGRGFKPSSNPSSQQNSRPASPPQFLANSTPIDKSTHGLPNGFRVLPDVTGVAVPKFPRSSTKNHDYENLQKIQNNISAIKTVNQAMTRKPPVPNSTRRNSSVPPAIRASRIPRRQSLSTDSSPIHKTKTLRRKTSVSPARARTPSKGRVITRRGVSLSPARQKSLAASTIVSKSNTRLNVPGPRGADKSPMRSTISSSYKVVSKSPKATRRNPDLVKRDEALKKGQLKKEDIKKSPRAMRRRTSSSLKIPSLSPIEGTPTKTDKKPVRTANSRVVSKTNSKANVKNGNSNSKAVTSPTRIPKRSTSKSSLTNSEHGSSDNLARDSDGKALDNKNNNNSSVNKTKTSINDNNSNNSSNDSDKIDNNESGVQTSTDDKDAATNTEKLVALTKSNVISMTTAAITAQPVQIATNVTNQIVDKTDSNNEDSSANNSQELQENSNNANGDNESKLKTYKSEKLIELTNNNTSDSAKNTEDEVKSGEKGDQNNGNSTTNPSENQNGSSNAKEDAQNNQDTVIEMSKDEIKVSSVDMAPVVQSVERKLSNNTHKAIAEVKGVVQVESVERSSGVSDKVKAGIMLAAAKERHAGANTPVESKEIVSEQRLKQLPDVEVQSGNIPEKALSNEPSLAEEPVAEKPRGICSRMCCCLPCCRGKACCKKKASVEDQHSEFDPNSTTALQPKTPSEGKSQDVQQKQSCWRKLSCCKAKQGAKNGSTSSLGTVVAEENAELSNSRAALQSSGALSHDEADHKRSCFDRMFCCRRANKISSEMSSSDMGKPTGCCGRCRKNKAGSEAWSSNRESSLLSAPPNRCCGVLCLPFARCCKCCSCCKKPVDDPTRRPSIFSKKQSLAPTLPPEDTRPKLDVSLIEHNSLMKGAIPILPSKLAWFCLICNVICPGLGTILSGVFCLCFGIPRFGIHEGPRQRIGSFVINILVGVAQLFTVLFCLVGWGWAIWWGVIMLKTSRKHRKLKLEARMADEEGPAAVEQNHRDVEQGR